MKVRIRHGHIRFTTALSTRRKVLTPGLERLREEEGGAERLATSCQYVRGGRRETISHAQQRTRHDALLRQAGLICFQSPLAAPPELMNGNINCYLWTILPESVGAQDVIERESRSETSRGYLWGIFHNRDRGGRMIAGWSG